MTRYFAMLKEDASDIALEHWSNTLSVGLHAHDFDELLLVDFGTCRHMYRHTQTMLIPGDAVLIRRGEEHGLSMRGKVSVYNCQFRADALGADVQTFLDAAFPPVGSVDYVPPTGEFARREDCYSETIDWDGGYALNTSRQGVAHLPPAARTRAGLILKEGLLAQEEESLLARALKKRCAELLLLELCRAIEGQRQKYVIYAHAHQELVTEALQFIDAHPLETIDAAAFAAAHTLSPGYFRKLFKDVTGFSPLAYTNRLRVIRAAALLQQGSTVGAAAESVGIYDLNYFSRLFKKIMGVSPSAMRG